MRRRAGDLEVAVEAGTHVSVTSLRHRGEELLVAPEALAPSLRVHETRAGITLLHPWANRIGPGFAVPEGAPRDEHGLPIHGLPLDWALDGERATAEVGFPAPHRAEVVFALDPGGLTVATRVQALDGPAPVAFGWHPYFRLPGAARREWALALPPRRHLETDAQGLPTGAGAREPAETAPLADRALDDGYDDLAPGAAFAIAGGGREIRVVLDAGYPAGQVFAPGGADVVSLEPMTAVTDALRSGGAPRLAPGEAFEAVFRVTVSG